MSDLLAAAVDVAEATGMFLVAFTAGAVVMVALILYVDRQACRRR
jgi:hypothetical protein